MRRRILCNVFSGGAYDGVALRAEFAAVGFSGFCAEFFGAALLEAKFEAGSVELRDAAAARELCDDEILEVELAADEF